MVDLRIVDAPSKPTEDITGEEKLPTGGSGNYSVTLDSVADFTAVKKDLADNQSVNSKVNGVRQELAAHIEDLTNPHQVTKVQIGLGNVDNTADLDKPVSNSTQASIISAVAPKADKSSVYTKSETYSRQETQGLVDDKISTALSPISSEIDYIERYTPLPYKLQYYAVGQRVTLSTGEIVENRVPNNNVDPNTDMLGWVKVNSADQIFDESGKTQQELNNDFKKFESQKLLLQNYVKPEHNGDASLALALAITDARTLGSCTIYGGFFSYSFKSKITIDLLNNTNIDFSDSVMIDTLNVDEVILFTNCKNVKILTNVVIGSATYDEFISNGAAYIYFIKFKNSTNCHQRGGSVSGLRNLIQLYDCNFSSFSENYQKGFLPDVDFGVFINNTNFLTLGSISGGKFNQAYKNFAENTGDVVIKQRDTFGAVTHTNSGNNLHDNGVYGSSEHSSVTFGNTFSNIRGTATKSRGSRNVVFANPSLDVDMGVSITGNGTADSKGANSHGSIGVFNPVKRSRSFGVSVDIQDGLYCRDVIIGFNTVNEHLGTTVQTPIRVNAVENALVVGNIFDEHGADYGITQIATSSKATNKSGVLAFNITSSTKPIARSTYGQYGVHLGNLNSLGVGIQYRFQEKTLSIGNLSSGAPVVDSSSYPCSDMTYIGNSGAATNISSQASAVVSANKSIINLIDATTLTPLPVQAGLLARDSTGASYISALIGSTLSWKKITVT